MFNKRGQVTIFIIIAIVLVASVGVFFVLRSALFQPAGIPVAFEPLYNNFITCIEDDTKVGISILESQGGYIELPEFESGSGYMPFSSQLNFLGNPIPYWYYVSGANVQKSQVPSKGDMEKDLEGYIEQEIGDCLFTSFEEFDVVLGTPEADVTIREGEVEVNLDMDMTLDRAEESIVVSDHEVIVKTSLGKLYDSARKIYDYEQDTLFLEEYAVDTLRLYAPVDGVEITCAPLIWSAEEVFDELEDGIEANVQALKVKGGDFELVNEDNKYFVIDLPVTEDVRFLNSKNWPHAFEVNPAEGGVLISNPVGNQPGLATLGFCYVPYHFVYDVKYPVLAQVYDGDEIFQFPMAVVLLGNKPREALPAQAIATQEIGLCENKNTQIVVNTLDINSNPVAADISFKCFGTTCPMGESQGTLTANFPQCVNGQIVATADGFQQAEKIVESTANPGFVDVFLNRLYTQTIEFTLDGNVYDGDTIIIFKSDSASITVLYPEQKTVELSQGDWEIDVYVYKDAELKLPATTSGRSFGLSCFLKTITA